METECICDACYYGMDNLCGWDGSPLEDGELESCPYYEYDFTKENQ
jgi:hypothetical protein